MRLHPRQLFFRFSILAIAAIAAVPPNLANAAAVTWTTTSSGFWDVATNWSSNPLLPGSADDVTIDVAGLATITHRSGADTIRTLNNAETVDVTGGTLTISSAGAASTNTGTLQANGGTLNLVNSALNNGGGTLAAISGALNLSGGTVVTGGTLSTSGGSIFTATGSTATLSGVTLSSGAQFIGSNASSTTLIGTITNSGTITLSSSANNTNLYINGNVTLAGGGSVTLGNNANNQILGVAATAVLTNSLGHTIEGAGRIGVDQMGLNNQGLVVANGNAGLVIDLNDGATTRTNTGTLRAGTGQLRIQNTALANAGGTIDAAGSNVLLSGATITGGTLQSSSGEIQMQSGSRLVNVTNAGQAAVLNGNYSYLQGTLTNNGTLQLRSSGSDTRLEIVGNVTLAGSGTLMMGNNTNNRIFANVSGDRLTNAVGHTIQGAGQVGVNLTAITNAGLIVANQPTLLQIDPNAAGGLTNTGTLRAAGGGTLELTGNGGGGFDNSSGTIEAQTGSTVRLVSGAAITGGTLATAGTGLIKTLSGHAGTLNGVTISTGSQFIGENNTTTTLIGTITNNGTVTLSSTGNLTNLVLSGDVMWAGGGVVSLGNNSNNRIYGNAGTERLTVAAGHTVQGAGQVGVNRTAISNAGLIVATQAEPLQIDPLDGAGNAINTGTFRADGGTLQLLGGTFTNTGGTIEAVHGSVVQLNGATVVGGILSADLTGAIANVGSATLSYLTNAARFEANNATATYLSGTIVNNRTMLLNSAGSVTSLRISGNVTLAGAGSLTMSNNGNNYLVGDAGAGVEVLTNSASHTIQGSGQLGNNALKLVNQGAILANQSTELVVNLTGGRDDLNGSNTGFMTAGAGGKLRVRNSGIDNGSGTLQALDASTVFLDDARINGGTLSTSGTGVIQIENASVLKDVTASGTLNVANTETAILAGTFTNGGELKLGSVGNATSLRISGNVTLAGAGSLTMSNNGNNYLVGDAGAGVEVLTNSASHTIQGSGQLGNNALKLVNQGAILANQSTELVVNLTGGRDDLNGSNTGFMTAGAGGKLRVRNSGIDNGSGTLQALDASTVFLDDARINGGTLSTSGTGVIQIENASVLKDVTASGTLNVANTETAILAGTFTNGGELKLGSVGNATSLRILGNVTLAGAGSLTMSNNGNNYVFGDTTGGGEVLTNSASHTIQGSGQLGNNALKLVNQGAILANQSTELVVNLTGGRDDLNGTNTGFMAADAGGKLRILSSGIDNASGTVQALNGSTVFLNDARINGGLLFADGTSTIQLENFSVLTGLTTRGLVKLPNTQTAYLVGTITNNGDIWVNSTGSGTDLQLAGAVTLAGPGTLTLGPNANSRVYGASGDGTEVLLNSVGHTIQGAGQLGVNRNGLDNRGLIVANQAAGLTIDLSGNAGVTRSNTGTLRAQGGTLTLSGTNLDNAGGLIEGAGSNVVIFGSIVTGGVLNTSGGALIELQNESRLKNLTNNGTVRLENTQTAYLEGTITNNGGIWVDSTGSNTDLQLVGAVTLAGPGILTLGPNANSRVYGASGGGTEVLLNSAGHTIQGAGQLGVNRNGLDNQGLIVANHAAGLTIDLSGNVGVTRSNTGTLRAQGGTLTLSGTDLDNTGGLIEGAGSTVAIFGSIVTGGLLNTSGGALIELENSSLLRNLTNNGAVRLANTQTAYLEGAIVNNGDIRVNSTGNTTDLRLIGPVTLGGSGTLTLGPNASSRVFGNIGAGAESLTNSVGHTIQGRGQIGAGVLLTLTNDGAVTANQNGGTLLFNASTGGSTTTTNTGVLRAENGGVLSFAAGTIHTVQSSGLVEALADSQIVFQAEATVTNLSSNTLSGGIWKANSVGGGSGLIDFQGVSTSIATNAADICLIGPSSAIRGRNASNTVQTLDQTLFTNSGALRLQQGRSFTAVANGGNFTNSGLLEVSNSTFTSNTLASSGAIASLGNSTVTTSVGSQVTGTGSISSSGGALTITRGVNMGAGSSMTSNAGAAINLSSAAAASQIGTLNNNGSLDLGLQNIVVTKDYTNANFGAGNTFFAHANVAGTGKINGNNAAQTISGNVINTGANTWNLNLGNVRGGTSTTVNYQIANNGTGADIRGAIQTGAPGLGNITDSRLSGSGVTAANFGAIAATGNSGNLAVTFNATSGGSLAGQSIAVVSNFDNVATQTINLAGTASALAQGSATPNSNPVNLGNFRVGAQGALTSFSVQNTTTGVGAEQLGIDSVAASTGFTASNAFGGGLIAPGSSQVGAITARANGSGSAGINTGTVTIQYATDGTNIDASFVRQGANSQMINLSATGYNVAVGSATPTPVTIANQRVGGTGSQVLTVSNTAPAGAFSEALNASFSGASGAATTNGGSVTNLIAGGSNGTAMSVGVNTATAGAKSGTVTFAYQTDGTGPNGNSGLAAISAGSQTINVSGNVYLQAQPSFGATTINLGNVHVGGTATQALSITNTNLAPGFQEGLNASFSGSTAGITTSGGPITNLAAGAPADTSLVVGVNTAAAGAVSGTATLALASNGTVSGLSDLSLPSQDISVSGNVIALANPQLTGTLNFGAIAVNSGPVQRAIQVSNLLNAPNASFQELLNATFGTLTNTGVGSYGTSGAVTGLGAGAPANANMVVTFTPGGTAGAISGNVEIQLVSDGTSFGLGTTSLGSQPVTFAGSVTGLVFNQAQGSAAPTDINFGNVRINTAQSQNLTISNIAPAGALTEGLNANFGANAGAATNNGGTITSLAGGDSNSSSMVVGLSTAVAGARSGTAAVNFLTDGSISGNAPSSVGTQVVNISGNVYRLANPLLNTPSLTVAARVGDVPPSVGVSVTNVSPDQYTEGLKASIATTSAGFTASGSITNLAAGQTDTSALQVGLVTATAGGFTGTATLTLASIGAGTTNAPDETLTSQDVTVNGRVYTPAVASLTGTADFGILHVGDTPATRQLTVKNAAAPTALNDVLRGNLSVTGPFSGGGNLASGLGAQAEQGFDISLNTSAAGVFNRTATLSGVSHNDEMLDLALADLSASISGQVNNYALALFTKTGGSGSLSQSNPYEFTLDFGIVTEGGGPLTALLDVGNGAVGPADLLDGVFDLTGVSHFQLNGFSSFADLGAGQFVNGLSVDWDLGGLGLGAFAESILLHPMGHNAGGFSAGLPDVRLIVRGTITEEGGAPVPEPDTLILLGTGSIVLAFLARRRHHRA